MNHFDVFEISPIRMDLSAEELEKKFHQLSRKFHPDHHSENLKALEESSKINGAYKILRDSWARGGYLLELLGIALGTKVPACLGSIYFELQEAGDPASLSALKDQLVKDNENRAKQLKDCFKNLDSLKVDLKVAQANQQVQLLLNKLAGLVLENRYALSMQRDIESKVSEALRA